MHGSAPEDSAWIYLNIVRQTEICAKGAVAVRSDSHEWLAMLGWMLVSATRCSDWIFWQSQRSSLAGLRINAISRTFLPFFFGVKFAARKDFSPGLYAVRNDRLHEEAARSCQRSVHFHTTTLPWLPGAQTKHLFPCYCVWPNLPSHRFLSAIVARQQVCCRFFCSLSDCDMRDPMWSSDIFWYLLISSDICASCTIAHIKIIKIIKSALGAVGAPLSVHWPRLASCERASSLLQRKCCWMSCHSVLCTLAGYLPHQCLLKTFSIFQLRIFDQIFWGWLYTLHISE